MCFFYPVFHSTLFILQNSKTYLPLLPRFAYFLVLLLGFLVNYFFALSLHVFQTVIVLFKFFVILKDNKSNCLTEIPYDYFPVRLSYI